MLIMKTNSETEIRMLLNGKLSNSKLKQEYDVCGIFIGNLIKHFAINENRIPLQLNGSRRLNNKHSKIFTMSEYFDKDKSQTDIIVRGADEIYVISQLKAPVGNLKRVSNNSSLIKSFEDVLKDVQKGLR